MMGEEKEILNIVFFSSINIYGENEDKALHMQTVRHADRGQL